MHPAGPVENANDAFPTGPWTARTPRRPQAAQALLRPFFKKRAEKNKIRKAANSLATRTGHFHLLSTGAGTTVSVANDLAGGGSK